MTPRKQIEEYVEDFGIEYTFYALDLEPAYIISYLIERNVIDKADLVELYGLMEDEDEDRTDDA